MTHSAPPTSGEVPSVPTAPAEVWGTFVGGIDQASVYRLSHWLNLANGRPVHLAFQSSGGGVGDGIFLYELLRKHPSPVTAYNLGSVASIATVAFLGARHRRAGSHATFMLHRSIYGTPTPQTGKMLSARVQSLVMDDQRIEAILRNHLKLDEARWNDLDSNDVWFTAEEAMATGLVHEIADFTPPLGAGLVDFNCPVQGMTP